MAFAVKKGTLQTGTGTSAIAVTGLGDLRNNDCVVLFWGGGCTADAIGTPTAHGEFGFGWMVATGASTADETAWGFEVPDDRAPDSTVRSGMYDACYVQFYGLSSAVGVLGFTSWDSDGFTVTPSDAFDADLRLNYMVLSGLTNQAQDVFTLTDAQTSAYDRTGPAFEPNLGFFSCPATAYTSLGTVKTGTASSFSLGVYDGTNSVVLAGNNHQTSGGTAQAMNTRLGTDAVADQVGGLGDSLNGDFTVTFDAAGYNLTQTSPADNDGSYFAALLLEIPDDAVQAGTFAAQTSTGTFNAVTGLGFTPSGFLCFTDFQETSAQATLTERDTGMLVVGGTDGTSQGFSGVVSAKQTPTWSLTDEKSFSDDASLLQEVDTGGTVDSAIAFDSFGASSVVLDQTNADDKASLIGYVVFGAAASGRGPLINGGLINNGLLNAGLIR